MIVEYALDRWLADNPLYRPASHGRTRRERIVTWVAGAALVLFYLQILAGAVLFGGSSTTTRVVWTGFLLGPMSLLIYLLAPALAATAIAAERTRGTLEMLVLTPFPRRTMLIGMTAERLRQIADGVLLSLPGFVLQAVHSFWWEHLGGIAPVLGLVSGLGLLCSLLLAVAAGLYASARVRSEAGAIVIAYLIILVARWIVGLGTSLVWLFGFGFSGAIGVMSAQAAVQLIRMALDLVLAWHLFRASVGRLEASLEA